MRLQSCSLSRPAPRGPKLQLKAPRNAAAAHPRRAPLAAKCICQSPLGPRDSSTVMCDHFTAALQAAVEAARFSPARVATSDSSSSSTASSLFTPSAAATPPSTYGGGARDAAHAPPLPDPWSIHEHGALTWERAMRMSGLTHPHTTVAAHTTATHATGTMESRHDTAVQMSSAWYVEDSATTMPSSMHEAHADVCATCGYVGAASDAAGTAAAGEYARAMAPSATLSMRSQLEACWEADDVSGTGSACFERRVPLKHEIDAMSRELAAVHLTLLSAAYLSQCSSLSLIL